MILHDRPVHFEDVDVAGIVFFARFFGYCHDAMERFFDEVEGGYVALVTQRKIGFPAVHASSDFKAPIRYGDVARIQGTVTKLGTTAVHFRFAMTRARDGADVATMNHVHVCSDLVTLTKLAFPADVRAALERHVVSA
jgi:4-hydroxybenzoyl-CoA thioesterase